MCNCGSKGGQTVSPQQQIVNNNTLSPQQQVNLERERQIQAQVAMVLDAQKPVYTR